MHPIGSRPSSVLRILGWLLAAAFCYFVGSALLSLASIAASLFIPGPEFWSAISKFVGGLLYVAVMHAALALLVLYLARSREEFSWAAWWVVLVDGLLGLTAAVATALSVHDWLYYGYETYWAYDFRAASWSRAIALAVAALSTLAALFIYSVKYRGPVEVDGAAAPSIWWQPSMTRDPHDGARGKQPRA